MLMFIILAIVIIVVFGVGNMIDKADEKSEEYVHWAKKEYRSNYKRRY